MCKNKGEYNGKCNITSCSTGIPALWFNHSTELYYCASCANRLNSDPYNKQDAQRLFGHDLCTKTIHLNE